MNRIPIRVDRARSVTTATPFHFPPTDRPSETPRAQLAKPKRVFLAGPRHGAPAWIRRTRVLAEAAGAPLEWTESGDTTADIERAIAASDAVVVADAPALLAERPSIARRFHSVARAVSVFGSNLAPRSLRALDLLLVGATGPSASCWERSVRLACASCERGATQSRPLRRPRSGLAHPRIGPCDPLPPDLAGQPRRESDPDLPPGRPPAAALRGRQRMNSSWRTRAISTHSLALRAPPLDGAAPAPAFFFGDRCLLLDLDIAAPPRAPKCRGWARRIARDGPTAAPAGGRPCLRAGRRRRCTPKWRSAGNSRPISGSISRPIHPVASSTR